LLKVQLYFGVNSLKMAITPEHVGAGNRKNTEIVELLLFLLLLCYRDQLLTSLLYTHLFFRSAV